MADPHETCTGMSGLHIHPPLGTSIFTLFSESDKITLNINLKGSISQNMRQNNPQSAPPGTPKGGPNLSKIITKSSLSRRGCLQVTSRGYPHPNIPKINQQIIVFLLILCRVWILALTPELKQKWRTFRRISCFGGSVSAGRVPGTRWNKASKQKTYFLQTRSVLHQ